MVKEDYAEEFAVVVPKEIYDHMKDGAHKIALTLPLNAFYRSQVEAYGTTDIMKRERMDKIKNVSLQTNKEKDAVLVPILGYDWTDDKKVLSIYCGREEGEK